MPRNGSGIYSLPPGSTITNGDTSDATDLNTPLADIATDLNTPRSIATGGTNATSAAAALVNLGLTATAAELNALDGITATTAELNILDGVTATASELNILDGATLTVTELNHVDGVTSPIQTQLDAKAPLASPTFTGVPAAPTATAGTDTTQVATTAFVQTAVSGLGWQEFGPVATTSGTSQGQTGLPAGISLIEFIADKISLNGTSSFLIQLGTSADGYVTSGYQSHSTRSGSTTLASTEGFIVSGGTAASGWLGNMHIRKKPGTNTWVEDHGGYSPDSTERQLGGGGRIELGSAVDRIRIISLNGTDALDGGDFSLLVQ